MLNAAVLCSKRAPGLEAILPDLTCVVTTHRSAVIDTGSVPLIRHPIRGYDDRRVYDALTVHVLKEMGVESVLLLSYLYVLSDVMLNAFPDRIFNIHDSDLSLRNAKGERRYVGLHSTRDAILAGEQETRSTLHVVTEQLDGGPIVAISRPYPVAPFAREAARAGHMDILKAYAYAQREWMMCDSWGDLARAALEEGEDRAAIRWPASRTLPFPSPHALETATAS